MSRQKDTAVNLAKFIDKSIIVKLSGGREGTFCCLVKLVSVFVHLTAHEVPPFRFAVVGILKGYDQLLNLVLDEAIEYLRGAIFP